MNGNPVSPKLTAAALAAAITTIIFFLLAIFRVFPEETDPALIAGVQGAVTTVLAFLLGYLIKDENREQGKGVPPS